MAPGSELQLTIPERVIGRYAIYDEIASGGMAVVHLGRMLGQAGFSRTVAIKRLHPQFAKDRNFVAMFLDEARLSVRVQHPNVVAPLDVLVADGEVLVVMEYVAGDTLSRLQRSLGAKEHPPTPATVVSIMTNALYGLHAAHEALGEDGTPLQIVHRDVSPQNIMVGTNGIARVLDFGVAKASVRSHCTMQGEVKGKLPYMAPEQVEGRALDRRTDVFAAGVVAWESLALRRLFSADQAADTISRILRGRVPPITTYAKGVPLGLDQAVRKALSLDPGDRYQTAREFAIALERACVPASPSEVGDWVKSVGGDDLVSRAERVAAIETKSSSSLIRPLQPPPRVSETVPIQLAPPSPSAPQPGQSHSRITLQLSNEAHSNLPAGPSVHSNDARQTHRLKRPLRWAALKIGVGLVVAAGLLTVLVLRKTAGLHMDGKAIPAASGLARAPLATEMPKNKSYAAGETAAPAARSDSASNEAADGSATTSAKPENSSPPVRHKGSVSPRASKATQRDTPRASEPAKARGNCNPPYVVDAAGIRRLRPECL